MVEVRSEVVEARAELRSEMHRLQNRTIGVLVGAMGVMTAVLALAG